MGSKSPAATPRGALPETSPPQDREKFATYWTPEQPSGYPPPGRGLERPWPREDFVTRAELIAKFRETTSEIAEQDLSQVGEDDVIADLGMDSLSMLELVGTLEREYDIRIPEEDLVSVETVRQLIDLVEKARGNAA